MATYRELKERAEKLFAQAEEARQKELLKVVEEIRSRMHELDIKLSDLGGSRGRPAARSSKGKLAVKFRDEAGNTWSGRGRRPRWLQARLDAGGELENFAL